MTNKRNWLIALAVVLVAGGLLYFGVVKYRDVKGPAGSANEVSPALVTEGSYDIDGATAEFHEGRAEALVTLSKKLPALKVDYELQNVTFGDLDGAGGEDAVAVLGMSSGGEWHPQSLVAFLNQDGRMQYAGNAFMGDRVVVESLDVADGVVTAKVLIHAKDDYLNEPTLQRTFKFEVRDGSLKEIQ